MRALRAALASISTSWAATDFSVINQAARFSATALATAAAVALASFLAVAMGLT
jgi:hypothetical protein